MNYLYPIKWAIIIFPFLSMLFTLPYIISQYHKYGSISFFKTIVVYAFILYLTTIYFLAILPLPSIESVKNLTTSKAQLIPFMFVVDFIKNTEVIWNDPSTYLKIFVEPEFYQVFFNILMFLPFGIYMRYYFKLDLKKTIIYAFIVSLFLELTQLTGIYFIYPRAYRLFDVDDLMINTTGALVGYLITPILSFLPSRNKMEMDAYKNGSEVSFIRRLVGFTIDLIIFSFIYSMVSIFIKNEFNLFISIVLYFILFQIIYKGTIGKRIVKIKLDNINNSKIKLYQYFIRYFILFIFILNGPVFVAKLTNNIGGSNIFLQIIYSLLILFTIYINILTFFDVIGAIFNKNKILIYEKISRTKNISTIIIDNETKSN